VPGIMVISRVNVIVIVGWGVGIILTSNPLSRERIEPSGFVTTIFQIPVEPCGMVK
jgi:energy-converting hydrogenase Eha subunit C